MNESIVNAKTTEFVNRYVIAEMLGNRERMRKYAPPGKAAEVDLIYGEGIHP